MSKYEQRHYESVEETDSARSASEGWVMPVRRRADLVAVVSWRLVCSCIILLIVRECTRVAEGKVQHTSGKRT